MKYCRHLLRKKKKLVSNIKLWDEYQFWLPALPLKLCRYCVTPLQTPASPIHWRRITEALTETFSTSAQKGYIALHITDSHLPSALCKTLAILCVSSSQLISWIIAQENRFVKGFLIFSPQKFIEQFPRLWYNTDNKAMRRSGKGRNKWDRYHHQSERQKRP